MNNPLEIEKLYSERIEELKEDKKKMQKLNDEIVAVLKEAKFGQNLTINWQNCTITSSEIDSNAISKQSWFRFWAISKNPKNFEILRIGIGD